MAKDKLKNMRLAMEKDLAELFKHIREQDFGSEEELQKFLNEAVVGKNLGEILPPKKGKKSNAEKAQDLLLEAFAAAPRKGAKLAQEAIKLDQHNADAYVYLADNENSLEKALAYYTKGVEAGKRAIGAADFEEMKGHFWGFHETRPFMRAKAGLASCLYSAGQVEKAINHFQEMLVLNPDDNQGIRYQLAICLVGQNKAEAFEELYETYRSDPSAVLQYTYALYLFKKEGSSLKSNRALKKAYETNPHVLAFLAGAKLPPDYLPDFMGMGDENEAIFCINDSGKIWLETAGAMEWAREFYYKQINKGF